jgi:plasmid stabilization system protein ParE
VGYRVRITARAERDLSALYGEIDAENSTAARQWYRGLSNAILRLEERPYSWPATRESRRLRHLFHGRKPHRVYRVIYKILEQRKLVDVLHIRHGSRRAFKPSDLG